MGIAAFVLAHWGLLYLPLCAAVPPLFCETANELFSPNSSSPDLRRASSQMWVSSGHTETVEQKDIDTTFLLQWQFNVFDQCNDKLWIYQLSTWYTDVSFGFNLVGLQQCRITSGVICKGNWFYWPWMRTTFMNVLADECFWEAQGFPNCSAFKCPWFKSLSRIMIGVHKQSRILALSLTYYDKQRTAVFYRVSLGSYKVLKSHKLN